MGNLIRINPINKDTLDSRLKEFDERLSVLFDFMKTDFTIMSYNNSRDLLVSKCQEQKVTPEVLRSYTNYHGALEVFFKENAKNIADGLIENTEIFNMITDVVFVPELVAVSFITAGYQIGMACVDAVYGAEPQGSVDYVVGNGDVVTIEGDELRKMADRYFLNDVEVASRLGYMYYHKTAKGFKNSEQKEQRLAYPNTSRFGSSSNINSVTALMRNMTSFVPIGYRWSSYTPYIFKDERWFNNLQNGTVLGYDMVEVPNFMKRDYASRGLSSTTIYTTKKRLHSIFNTEVDFYNFSFIYKVLASMYVSGRYFTNAQVMYVDKETRLIYTDIEYGVLKADVHDRCVRVDSESNPNVSKLIASKLVKTYINTMVLMYSQMDEAKKTGSMVENLTTLTMDKISADVEFETQNSIDMFGYVE